MMRTKIRGVQHDALTDIAHIRATLKGYGDGFPIIKELIQNAEDGNASFLSLGWHPGFADENEIHPLLTGPALCVVNNSPFKKMDEDAICRIGLGSKSANAQAIGRFGLGLKSVFHLCEAFFFMASDLISGEDVRLLELFNPWHPKQHEEWDEGGLNDERCIREALSVLIPKPIAPWFALWLPLRRRVLHSSGVAAIIENYPGDSPKQSGEVGKMFQDEIMDVLPVLGRLSTVTYSVWEQGDWHERYTAGLEANCNRGRFPKRTEDLASLVGKVTSYSAIPGTSLESNFVGFESWLSDELFNDLSTSERWPKVVGITDDGADAGQPEKTVTHYAAYFTRRNLASSGSLRIRWCVFLPVGSHFYDLIPLPNVTQEITLMLHGYFFLNPDRTNIDGLDSHFDEGDNVYTLWNQRLARQGTLRTVIPALNEFVKQSGFSDMQIAEIISAIRSSKLISNFSGDVCAEWQYAFIIGSNRAEWLSINADDAIYALPVPAQGDLSLPLSIFPRFKELATNARFTFVNSSGKFPIISSREYSQWPATLVEDILKGISAACVPTDAAAHYLLSFLKGVSADPALVGQLLPSIPLFDAYSYRDEGQRRLSYQTLLAFAENGTLFFSFQPSRLLASLQSACPDLNVVSIGIKDDIFDVTQLLNMSHCDVRSCSNATLKSCSLGSIDERSALLSALIMNPNELRQDVVRRAARFLLHGEVEQSKGNETLFVKSTAQDSQTWNRLLSRSLQTKGEGWRLLDSRFTQLLNPLSMDLLQIESVSMESACRFLAQVALVDLDLTDINGEDRRRILLTLDDLDVIKALPIHERLDGIFVRIDSLTFLDSDFKPEGELAVHWNRLANMATIIKRQPDGMAQARQKELMPELDWQAALDIALKSESPASFAQVIMIALANIGNPRQETGIMLRTKKWIPLVSDMAAAPEQVIHVQGVEKEIRKTLDRAGDSNLVGILHIAEWMRDHRGFKPLIQHMPKVKDALRKLGSAVEMQAEMKLCLRVIRDIPDSNELGSFLRVFSLAPSNIMPCYELLKAVSKSDIADVDLIACETLIPCLIGGDIQQQRLEEILLYLSSQRELSADIKEECEKWFKRYLSTAVEFNVIKSILPKLKLLNRKGNWVSSRRLAWPSEGISPADQLNDDQARLLDKLRIEMWQSPVPLRNEQLMDIDDSAKAIIKYFQAFEREIPGEMIGAVAALLGDHKLLKEWAIRMIASRSLDTMREDMVYGANSLMNDNSRKVLMSRLKFHCRIVSGNRVKVNSIVGDEFEAIVTQNPQSLLFGDGRKLQLSKVCGSDELEQRILELIDPTGFADMTSTDLQNVFRRTAEVLACHVFLLIRRPDFSGLWEKLAESEQTSLFSAQLYVLNSGELYVRQLDADKHPKISDNMAKWDEARKLEVDADLYPNRRTELLEKSFKSKRAAREELRKLIENDDEVHAVLAGAMKKKMESFQYRADSIPFEIFQNADDAYQELDFITPKGQRSTSTPRFIMIEGLDYVSFAHWGRSINQSSGFIHYTGGKSLGFERDLQKMMILNFSDKGRDAVTMTQEARGAVTGKFGLGFKSVFFLTPSPRVFSGKLAFHVRGGFLPALLPSAQKEELLSRLEALLPESSKDGTLFMLPSVDTVILNERPFNRFIELLPYLLVFAKRIKACSIESARYGNKNFVWSEKPLLTANNCFIGRLDRAGVGAETLLVLRPEAGITRIDECGILFCMNSHGFSRLAKNVPSMWITAPTREEADIGFAVNGPFDPDVGRARLSLSSSGNQDLSNSLASSVGLILLQLFDATQDAWLDISDSFHLASDTSVDSFWGSLWNLMSSQAMIDASVSQKGCVAHILFSLAWGDSDSGYFKLLSERQALPSGLAGKYDLLIKLSDLNSYSEGALDSEAVFTGVATWDSFQSNAAPGMIVSGSKVFRHLRKLIPNGTCSDAKKVTFSDAIVWEVGNRREVTSESAERLGLLISEDLIKKFESGGIGELSEWRTVKEILQQIKFKTKAGSFLLSDDLLSSLQFLEVISKDETLRAAFAPEDRVISTNYCRDALRFFALCREKMKAPVEILQSWAHEAIGRKLSALFEYLTVGDLRVQLAEKLGMSWFERVQKEAEFDALDSGKKTELIWLFRVNLQPWEPPKGPISSCMPELVKIYDWWMARKDDLIRRYEIEVFPVNEQVDIRSEDMASIETDQVTRKKWMTLFMLGSFHTMGMKRNAQDRAFIELFSRNGWMDKISMPSLRPETLIEILDEYLSNPFFNSEYYEWMKQFVTFYQSAKWLEDYVFSFLEIEKRGANFSLDTVLNIRDSSWFSGTGIEAPPFGRALGIGSCFIVRELLRRGVLTNRFAHHHAYVPSLGTRKVLSSLGYHDDWYRATPEHAKYISDFLIRELGEEKATFGMCFDIPFSLIAKHPDLLSEIPDVRHDLIQEAVDYFED